MLEIHCSGSPYEIGYQHGSAARTQVLGSIAFYRGLFMKTCALDWPAVRVEAGKFMAPLQASCPRYMEEVRGIAAGAGVDELDVMAVNVRTEITFGLFTAESAKEKTAEAAAASGSASGGDGGGGMPSDGCTSLAYRSAGSASFLGQNWDWMLEQAPNLVVCHIQPAPAEAGQPALPTIAMVTEGGVIGKIGLNSAGVGVCLNAIRARGVDFSQLPIHFALRRVLESPSRAAAVATLLALGRTAGSGHLLVADGVEGGTGVECTSHGIRTIAIDARGVVGHTNHLVLDHVGVNEPPWLADSPQRLARLDQLLTAAPVVQPPRPGQAPPSADAVRSTLMDIFRDEQGFPASINRSCTGISTSETLFTILMELSSKTAVVSVGRPSAPTQTINIAL